MPYKDPQQHRAYHRTYMRKYRQKYRAKALEQWRKDAKKFRLRYPQREAVRQHFRWRKIRTHVLKQKSNVSWREFRALWLQSYIEDRRKRLTK